jgi:hypothetical protein
VLAAEHRRAFTDAVAAVRQTLGECKAHVAQATQGDSSGTDQFRQLLVAHTDKVGVETKTAAAKALLLSCTEKLEAAIQKKGVYGWI